MTSTDTQSKISDWVTSTYGAQAGASTPDALSGSAAPAPGGLLSAATPAAQAVPTMQTMAAPASTAPSTAPKAATPDVASWYRAVLGRDGDAGGISFWQNALKGGATTDDVFRDFESAAGVNHEKVKGITSWQDANNYSGPASTDGGSVVDDWGRNVLGRNLTGDEMTKWSSAMKAAATPEQAQKVYQEFLTTMGGQVRTPMDLASASQISTNQSIPDAQYQPYLITPSQITERTIDPGTETVQGQVGKVLAADSPVMQQARAGALTMMNERGLLNSALAASAGQDAAIRAATGIATSDAQHYNDAANYNAAAKNQAAMANTQAQNNFLSQSQGLAAQATQQDKSLASQVNLQAQQLASQQQIAQMQNETSRWQAELSNATSRYNTDSTYKQQAENQIRSLSNNIIQNMDLSPDRKAAMLEALGQGTSAKRNDDGTVTPGTGLAGAVYVIGSVAADLQSGGSYGGTYGSGSTEWGPNSTGWG